MMKIKGTLLVVMIISLFSSKSSAAAEEAFWGWFVKNEPRLFAFERDQERVFDELAGRLGQVNPDLTFEFGPVREGKREFVITAGGIKAAFPAVEALYDAAPSLPRWTWVKFRPRRPEIGDLTYGDTTVRADDVHYLLVNDGARIGVVLFFDEYTEQQRETYGQIGYLLLDEALGEYAVETELGMIEFENRRSPYFAKARPLKELPAHFDAVKAVEAH